MVQINWEPFWVALAGLAAFVACCFLAAVSDVWAKSSRSRRPGTSKPYRVVRGERVCFN
jgi:hypothetical protein